ncbi:MAG: hypothetical protein ACOCXA_09175, partial [Planctomycetota bacterium]
MLNDHIHLHHSRESFEEVVPPPRAQHRSSDADEARSPAKEAAGDEPKPEKADTATSGAAGTSSESKGDNQNPDTIREQILSEIQEQEALEEFRQNRPEMWLQVMRVGRMLELQEDLDDEIWPEGSCFLHANTVGFQSFCVRRVLDVDLETCTVALSIYGDEDLEDGTVLIPLEAISWKPPRVSLDADP